MLAAISPIAESPELSERNTSATPEAVSLVADSTTLQAAQPEAQTLERGVTGKLEYLSLLSSTGLELYLAKDATFHRPSWNCWSLDSHHDGQGLHW